MDENDYMVKLMGLEANVVFLSLAFLCGFVLFGLVDVLESIWSEWRRGRRWAKSEYKDYPEFKWGPFIRTLVVEPAQVEAIMKDNKWWMTATEFKARYPNKYYGVEIARQFNAVLARLTVTHPGKAYLFDIENYA